VTSTLLGVPDKYIKLRYSPNSQINKPVNQYRSKTSPLTNTEVKQAKPKDKLNDGGGLLLRVKPNGFETWIFDY
jgi:hypothetical protein